MAQNQDSEYPYMGPRPGAPDADVQEQMAAAVRACDVYNRQLKLLQAGGFPLGSPQISRVTYTPETDRSKFKPHTPPKGSTG